MKTFFMAEEFNLQNRNISDSGTLNYILYYITEMK